MPVKIQVDCSMRVAELTPSQTVSLTLGPGRQAYLLCVEGTVAASDGSSSDGSSGARLVRHDARLPTFVHESILPRKLRRIRELLRLVPHRTGVTEKATSRVPTPSRVSRPRFAHVSEKIARRHAL